MWSAFPLLLTLATATTCSLAAPAAPQWRFDLKETLSGIVALEAIVVSPTLVVMFDRKCHLIPFTIDAIEESVLRDVGASDDPLQINGHSAWGALWDLETNTVQPLDVLTNSFCASGALLSNGTMVCPAKAASGKGVIAFYTVIHTFCCCRSVLAVTSAASQGIRPSTLETMRFVSLSLAPPRLELAVRFLKIQLRCTLRQIAGIHRL